MTRRTAVMGVLNVTPDSFSDGGQFLDPARAVDHALAMAEQGADILDLGGESTRPGSKGVAPQEQIRRLRPVLERLRPQTDLPISIDTTSSAVAREMLALGADIINDISAFRGDPALPEVLADSGAGVVLMHMQGMPATMQADPQYTDVVREVRGFLRGVVGFAVQCGIAHERIAIDPGIGFGKTTRHNLQLLAGMESLAELGRPVLAGVSRKGFIGKVLNLDDPRERLEGTLGAVAASVLGGAAIVRVHDVRPVRRVVDMLDAIGAAARSDIAH